MIWFGPAGNSESLQPRLAHLANAEMAFREG